MHHGCHSSNFSVFMCDALVFLGNTWKIQVKCQSQTNDFGKMGPYKEHVNAALSPAFRVVVPTWGHVQVSYLWGNRFSLECHFMSITNTIPKNTFSMTLCSDEWRESQNVHRNKSKLNAWLIGWQIKIPVDSILKRYLKAKTQKVFGSFCVIL